MKRKKYFLTDNYNGVARVDRSERRQRRERNTKRLRAFFLRGLRTIEGQL